MTKKTIQTRAARAARIAPYELSLSSARAARFAARAAHGTYNEHIRKCYQKMDEQLAPTHSSFAEDEKRKIEKVKAIILGYIIRRRIPKHSSSVKQYKGEDARPRVFAAAGLLIACWLDGHRGAEVTNLMDAYTDEELLIKLQRPADFIKELQDRCATFYSGAMVTCMFAKRAPCGSWDVTVAWRGDAPLTLLFPDGSTYTIKPDTPRAHLDSEKDPRWTSVELPGPSWKITKEGNLEFSTDHPIYAKCSVTDIEIATFGVVGDRNAFSAVPTNQLQIRVPRCTQIVAGSDGCGDMIHPDDPFLRTPGLTAEMYGNEADRRWHQSWKMIDQYGHDLGKTRVSSPDDQSGSVISLS